MTRYEDWPRRLDTFLQAASGRPFSWGQWDCCTLAADAIEAMTGADPLADWRGRYATAEEALRLLAPAGGLLAVCTDLFGEPLPPLLARRGDLVLVECPAVPGWPLACGVVDLTGRSVACPGPDGLQIAPISLARHAWRVG